MKANKRHLDGGAFQYDQMIFNPTEILDQKQKEWEAANPEKAARDPEREMYMRPEFYEQEMEKNRIKKVEAKRKEKEANKPE